MAIKRFKLIYTIKRDEFYRLKKLDLLKVDNHKLLFSYSFC